MKKTIISIATVALFASCNKLDIKPTSFITLDQFYKTEADAVAGVTAAYSALNIDPTDQSLYGRNLYFLTDMGSDYAIAGASAINANVRAISALTYDANNDRVQLAWKQLYTGIYRANVAIDHIPGVQGSDAVKARLINEAKFLRALFYFNAVRLWGGVPLVLHEPSSIDINDLKVNRSTVEEVYQQIIKDLTDAEALPSSYTSADAGRATGGAAKSLLVKVYLTRKEWTKAADKAREVISPAYGGTGTYNYDLVQNFADLFDKTKKNGKEHIFSAQFEPNLGGDGSSGSRFSAAFAGFSGTQPADILSSVPLFYDIYQPGDTRRDVSYAKQLNVPGLKSKLNPSKDSVYVFPLPLFRKYIDTTSFSTTLNWSINFPIIRYADVLLSLAEAINEDGTATPEAYEAINQVRRRAFGKPVHTPDPSVDLSALSKVDFRQAIYEERKKEFVQEGQRWFDLVRWGTLVDEVKKVASKSGVSDRNNLYPIPQSERNFNPTGLPQNPGYN